MKKLLSITLMMAAAAVAVAQYQLSNPGFEQWDGGNTTEPAHWSSFASSDGSFSALASTPQHYRRNGGRPGSAGSYYLTIYTRSIIGIKANGNMTTGRVHAGAMSASSSNNYNYTQRTNSDHCHPFSGTPDSMYVWVSFYASESYSKAQLSAIIHGDNDFRSPNDENNADLYCGKAVASFYRTSTSANTMEWQQAKVPFEYSGNSTANYILFNITTNAIPGSGSADDSLSVDDIEFIYSAWLTGISVAGNPIANFNKGVLAYSLHVDDLDAEVTATTEVDDATVSIERQTLNDSTVLVNITVTAEDSTTVRHYSVTLTNCQSSVGITDVATMPTLSVYPNPASDIITVEADGEVEICDLQGRLLLRRNVHGLTQFDLSSLPYSAYILRCGKQATTLLHQK